MNRRSFTFASLALAVNSSAQGFNRSPAPAGMLTPTWTHAIADGFLVLGLKTINTTQEPLSVMLRSDLSGTSVQAFLGGPEEVELVLVPSDASKREAMSRAAPTRRYYQPVGPGAAIDLGVFKFTLPADFNEDAFRVVANVLTDKGQVVFNLDIPSQALARRDRRHP